MVKKREFEAIIDSFRKEKNKENQFKLACYALNWAVNHHTGYFHFALLENYFCSVAQSLNSNIQDIRFEPHSFLHVLTRGFNVGGHTRVVERWIENAPATQKHSVVILNPAENITLKNLNDHVVNQGGTFFTFEKYFNIKEKALKLRELGMHFEYIILHTHANDPTGVIAFGTEDFKRPVLIYNHASNLFWIGKSICDLLLELSENDQTSVKKRGIKNRFVLGVPAQKVELSKINRNEKIELRKKLNLPIHKKIIISAGSLQKYTPIGKNNFLSIVSKLLNKKTALYIIGVPKNHPKWKRNHVYPLGIVDFNKDFLDYLRASDLYLDSFPICGYTALIDAISAGVPALSLQSTILQMDYLFKTKGLCLTKKEFIQKSKEILNNNQLAEEIVKEEQKYLSLFLSAYSWNERVNELLKIAPTIHQVKKLSEEQDICVIDDLSVMNNILFDSHFADKRHWSFIFKRIFYKIERSFKNSSLRSIL